MKGQGGQATTLKSNNPHLTGGEQTQTKKGTRTMMGRTDMKMHENTISVLTIHDLDINI